MPQKEISKTPNLLPSGKPSKLRSLHRPICIKVPQASSLLFRWPPNHPSAQMRALWCAENKNLAHLCCCEQQPLVNSAVTHAAVNSTFANPVDDPKLYTSRLLPGLSFSRLDRSPGRITSYFTYHSLVLKTHHLLSIFHLLMSHLQNESAKRPKFPTMNGLCPLERGLAP